MSTTISPTAPTTQSEGLFAHARERMPGGVNSPVRAFGAVGGTPRFIREAKGAWLTDVDGNRLIDTIGSWGPMILGHAHPEVVEAIREAAARGTSFGCPTELENEMADLVCESVPSIEAVRMVNSGTEAGMAVVRLARGATGRDKIIKMIGCYHGHADSLLVKAGSGVATFGLPDSPGVTPGAAADTICLRYNDLAAVEAALEREAGKVAAVLLEPVAGNMGLAPPAPGYLEGLRELTARDGALLVFDEVMSGFRVELGGAQARYGVTPDLTMLGKVIGGGLPVGAYGGRSDLMRRIAPEGPIYQAGTLSGNPLAMTAGLTTLRVLKRDPGIYDRLDEASARLAEGLEEVAREARIPVCIQRVGSMIGMFFTEGPVTDFADAQRSDTERHARWFHAMLDEGVYLPPSQFETIFVSAAHGEEEIELILKAARRALSRIG